MKRKHALVLGGTGYIGSPLTDLLIADPDYRVTVLVHHSVDHRRLEGAHLIEGSIQDLDHSLFKHDPVDVIFHLARNRGRRRLGAFGRKLAAGSGRRANQRLIASLRELSDPPKVVYVSGSLVYGDCEDELVTERMPLNPIAFAREYVLAEEPWMEEAECGQVPTVILRPPWIFGNDSWFKHFYLSHIRSTGSLPQYGEGNNWMTLLHVNDCAGLIKAYADQPVGTYNIFMGEHLTYSEFIERLARRLDLPVKKYSDAELLRSHGKTFYEAFTFSCKLGTDHEEVLRSTDLDFPYVGSLLDEAARFLERE